MTIINKQKIILLDTETTGVDEDDRLCQIAYKHKENLVSGLFRPPKPISIGASSVSHITNKMVEDKENFMGSKTRDDLQDLIDEGGVIVAHNAIFDIKMLLKEGMAISDYIDTLKLAMFLDTESKCEKYNMQYLRYYYGLEINVQAHSADGDVLVLEKIFDILRDGFEKQFGDECYGKMLEVSVNPMMLRVMSFGKHRGVKMLEVPTNYLRWLLSTGLTDKPDLLYTINKILESRRG